MIISITLLFCLGFTLADRQIVSYYNSDFCRDGQVFELEKDFGLEIRRDFVIGSQFDGYSKGKRAQNYGNKCLVYKPI